MLQNTAVSLNTDTRNAFDSKAKQIKNGMSATDPKDYVTLDQVVTKEDEQL